MASMLTALCALLALQGPTVPGVAVSAAPPPLIERIAVIGASASSGFGTHVRLADALEAQVATKHQPIQSFADETFFLDPGAIGEGQVERAVAIEPTLVVAADFLFWFGYGEVLEEEERLENLEMGLELLEELKCPLLIGRFPDMTPAVGKMLLASQVPEKKTLEQLNSKLEAWAKERGQVGFVPMPDFLDKLRSGQPFTAGGIEFSGAPAKKRLMQGDDLHPTAEGLGILARLCIETACEPAVGAKAADFRSELAPVLEALRKLDDSRSMRGLKLPVPSPTPGEHSELTPRDQPLAELRATLAR